MERIRPARSPAAGSGSLWRDPAGRRRPRRRRLGPGGVHR
ncbi:hypothetical protein Ae331Ps2_2571 [Pseudonocardia sp. Ae331_Ps2]|nr:hypothetical protein Ae331Ps2_2571 [Pseudonocardia sp. Ae331_Ps2]